MPFLILLLHAKPAHLQYIDNPHGKCGDAQKDSVVCALKMDWWTVFIWPYLQSWHCRPHRLHRSHCWLLLPPLLHIVFHAWRGGRRRKWEARLKETTRPCGNHSPNDAAFYCIYSQHTCLTELLPSLHGQARHWDKTNSWRQVLGFDSFSTNLNSHLPKRKHSADEVRPTYIIYGLLALVILESPQGLNQVKGNEK